MKRIINFILGVWCAFSFFISPIWLTMIFLDITGLTYKYDYSMDEGTAIILGIISLIIWILVVLIPNIIFLKKMYLINKKYFGVALVILLLLAVLCIAMCRWNIVAFLFAPGGVKFGF